MRSLVLAVAILLTVAIPARAEMPKPFGVPLGATMEDVRKALPDVQFEQTDTSAHTLGPMLETDGAGLDIQGLQHVLMVFSKDRRLEAVQMQLDAGGINKPAYDRVLGYLKKQYPLKSSKNPFVGNKEALFAGADWRIELNAPHMSFSVTVTYMTQTFFQTVNRNVSEREKQKAQQERRRF